MENEIHNKKPLNIVKRPTMEQKVGYRDWKKARKKAMKMDKKRKKDTIELDFLKKPRK
jgi:hypothetical protein